MRDYATVARRASEGDREAMSAEELMGVFLVLGFLIYAAVVA